MGAYFIGLPPRLRNNCAEPVYNFKSDDIECITQERERSTTADLSGGEFKSHSSKFADGASKA